MPGRRTRRTHRQTKPARRARRPQAAPVEKPAAKAARYHRIFRLLDRTYPESGLALVFSTPLELLIALILAAQCTDERVNQVTRRLFRTCRSPEDWIRVEPAVLEAEIRSTGFYRNKAKTIQACCRSLVERFGGTVPDRLEDLITLPGVGRKTANILRGNAFGHPAIGVDTHVLRLAQRLGFSERTDADKVEFDLNDLVPDEQKVRFCHLLQMHGRARCHARTPDCPACEVKRLCPYPSRAAKSKP